MEPAAHSKTWPGVNYDYFWIVDFADGKPMKFEMVKQDFQESVKDVPENDWSKPTAWRRRPAARVRARR
jgi:hypothetical protein